MKTIKLSKGYFAQVSDKDYGKVSQWKWCAQVRKRKDGSIKNVYALHNIHNTDGTTLPILLHRFILGVTDTKVEVDHKDHNGLNCQRSNIRKATGQQNKRNSSLRKNNTSGFKGVTRKGEKFQASLRINKKLKHLGLFSTARAAALCYDRVAKKIFGRFATLNF